MSSNSKEFSIKVQKMGSFLSSMIMPNIGAFIAWGLITAFFIPTGWMPNEYLNNLVGPTLTYLMPILIGYTGGYNIYGKRGGVAGAIATMGVVIGADITMLIGGMIMGPIGAILIKQVDKIFEGKVKSGMEMLVDNFTMGIIGAITMIVGFVVVEPVFDAVLSFLTIGVQALIDRNLLPFTSFFVMPGQVLFLNNAINHGIMIPLGIQQAVETGKSILFLVEANGGAWFGLVVAFAMFGKGIAKKSAPAACGIQFLGGIGEVAFPYALMKPLTLLGPIIGNTVSLFILQIFNGGTVAAVSPGSFIALLLMTPRGSFFANIFSYFAGAAVSCVIVGFFLLRDKSPADDEELSPIAEAAAAADFNPLESASAVVSKPSGKIKKVVFACDAGMGSSAMGVSMLKTKMKKAMLNMDIIHVSVAEIPNDADVVITNSMLAPRARDVVAKFDKEVPVLEMQNFLDKAEYDTVIDYLKANA